jgi:GAF domain-containing protein
MADRAALSRILLDFAHTLVRRYEIGDVLYRLSDGIVEVLGVDGAGVCLADEGGRQRFVSATNEVTARVEQVQEELGEGPCGDAYRRRAQVIVPDITLTREWPRFRRAAVDAGIRAIAGIPMPAGAPAIGALNVYSAAPRDWNADDREAAQLLADVAASYVTNAMELERSRTLAEQLQHALDSRVVIEQAKGVIAERHGIDPSAAFELLRSHARRSGGRIRAIAQDVVDGTLRP